MITLQAEAREKRGKKMRKGAVADMMPAVVYGPKHEAVSIAVKLTDFTRILRNEGDSSVLEITGLGAPFQVLIHDIDRDPVTTVPRHADLYAIQKGAKVTVAIPLSFVGESAAVKAGANLVKVMHELEIESDPANLPHEIEVDISVLVEIGDQIHVSDVKLPKGVTAMVEGTEVVVLTQEVVEEVEEASIAPDMDAIEVEKKGKEVVEDAE
jgi:large subunit ribosomal protein L25